MKMGNESRDGVHVYVCTICNGFVGTPYWLNPHGKADGGRLLCQKCWDSLDIEPGVPVPTSYNVPPTDDRFLEEVKL